MKFAALVAGFAGGVASLSFVRELTKTQAVISVFTVTGDLTLDKNQNRDGFFSIRSNRGAFQYRWVKMFGRVNVSFEAGWLLDVYVKDEAARVKHPRAIFMCSPQIKFNQ